MPAPNYNDGGVLQISPCQGNRTPKEVVFDASAFLLPLRTLALNETPSSANYLVLCVDHLSHS